MSRTSFMTFLAAIWLTALLPLAAGKPRVATVDATTLFLEYHRTKTEQTKLAEAKLKLQGDPRLAVIKEIGLELRDLRTQARNTNNSEHAREDAFRKFQMKSHELRSLQRDTTQHLEARQKELNQRLVTMSKALLAEIRTTVNTVAAAEGYDMVFEMGGDTSSQVPTLLYIRHGTDITDLVVKELNKNKPPRGVTPIRPAPSDDNPGGQPPSPPASPLVPGVTPVKPGQ